MIQLPPRYQNIIDTFSAGGMADTYLCEDAHLKRKVVIKTLKPGIAPHRLRDEIAALSAIRSRYVVQVYDIIIDNGIPVGFVEEYLAGEPLAVCPDGCSVEQALRIIYPICAGIADIHDHDRVHRDLKPDNMRYDAEGHLKIYDFGLAKVNPSSGTSALFFSPGFTAPEAFRRDAVGLHQFDYPVDVYAFGCISLWLLNGGIIPDSMMQIPPSQPNPAIDFHSFAVGLPAAIANLLNRCLLIDPASRPTINECKVAIAAEILRAKHKMLLTYSGQEYLVDNSRKSRTISTYTHSVTISYDGLIFYISQLSGVVVINNADAYLGQVLSGAMVIVLGIDDRANGRRRVSVTCDVSHPEVTL